VRKKKWMTPLLMVLVRRSLEEMVLAACKYGPGISDSSIFNTNNGGCISATDTGMGMVCSGGCSAWRAS
jgi:hypothetical protein